MLTKSNTIVENEIYMFPNVLSRSLMLFQCEYVHEKNYTSVVQYFNICKTTGRWGNILAFLRSASRNTMPLQMIFQSQATY